MAPPGGLGLGGLDSCLQSDPPTNEFCRLQRPIQRKKGHLEHPGVYYTCGYIELTLAFDDKGDECHWEVTITIHPSLFWWLLLFHLSIRAEHHVIVTICNQTGIKTLFKNAKIFHLINLSSFIHNEHFAITELCSIYQGCLLNPTASLELVCDVLHRPDLPSFAGGKSVRLRPSHSPISLLLHGTITHPTKPEKKNHLQTYVGCGYVSSQESIYKKHFTN